MYPIWIINCEKHKERWKNMEMEMQKQNITDYQKFKAIEFSNSNFQKGSASRGFPLYSPVGNPL